MIWIPVLFLQLAFSQDLVVERYCFSSEEQLQKIMPQLSVVFVPNDKVERESNCLSVSVGSHRRELVQNFIRNVDPRVNISFSSAESKQAPCRIKVEKQKTLLSDQSQIRVAENPNAQVTTNERVIKEVTQIQTQKNFELTVNQDVIKGTCLYITPILYEITLEVRKDPRPLIPGQPTGSTIVPSNPSPPADQETAVLKTTLQLKQGDYIEIGSVVKDLKEKSHNANISPAFEASKTDVQLQEKTYLNLE